MVIAKRAQLGMPMRKPAPPPSPFPLKHFAMGTSDAQIATQPAPGQTVTGGSWTGPAPQTPAQPSLGGQNQNLRKALGMGVPRYAEGTPDAGPADYNDWSNWMTARSPSMSETKRQYNHAYRDVDNTFAKQGVGTSHNPPGYAGGTPDAGPAMANTNPPDLSRMPFLTQMSGGPVVVPDDGPTMQPSGNGFGMALGQGQAPTQAPTQAPAPTQSGFNAPPPQGKTGGLMDYLVGGSPAAGAYNGKPHDNPSMIETTAAATGANPNHVAAMLEPHQYTHDEFVAATRNMPWGIAEKLWGMQHYLNPQQQLLPTYLQKLENDTLMAQQAHDDAVKNNAPKATLDTLSDQVLKNRDAHNKFIERILLPGIIPYTQ